VPIVDFHDHIELLIVFFVLFLIIFFRYVLVAGLFVLIYYVGKKKLLPQIKINTRPRKDGQSRREILWSLLSSGVFSLISLFMIYFYQEGYTMIYYEWHLWDILYIPCSIFIALFLQDTYYYWLHRWMHRPRIYKLLHKVHHESVVTSPWTSFSFHPAESILQAISVPILIIIMPFHVIAVFMLLIIMTVTAVINHLDIEIYPRGFENHFIGKYLIGATHHSIHHTKFLSNYGLYFTFWDAWAGTESPLYHKKIDERNKRET